jgi:hypothetical protein
MIAGAFTSVSGKADKTLDTNGQILYYNSGRQALNIGSEGKVLTVSDADLPAWETASSGLSSPLTEDLVWNDSIEANFGTGGGDSKIYHNGTNWHFDPVTGYIIISGNFSMDAGTVLALNRAQATVSSGVITGTANTMLVSAEGGASTDDLDSANFSAAGVTGCYFTIMAYSETQTIVVKDQTGGAANAFLGAGDFSLDNYMDTIYFVADAGQTHNYEVSRSDNGS